MLEPEVINRFWPPLVREVVNTVEYPGYRYEFFRSFAELDRYFTLLCGSDWLEQPWAKFWIGQHNTSRSAYKREIARRNGQGKTHLPRKNPDEIIAHIHAICDQATGKLSVRRVRRELKMRGYELSIDTTFRYYKKVLSET